MLRLVRGSQFVVAVLCETLDFFFSIWRARSSHRAVAVEPAHFDDRTVDARRQAQRRVAHVRGLSPKMARSFSSGVIWAFALRRDLADQDIARLEFGADATMPASSRLRSASSPTFGMSRVISSGPSLVSRAATSNSSMWIEVNTSSLTMRSEIRIESSKL